MKKGNYTPEWISEQDCAKWLGVTTTALFLWRKSLGLNWTNINGKTIMYDKKQITELLNKNSTYAVTGKLNLTTANAN